MERSVEPLTKQAMSLFVEAAEQTEDDLIKLTSLFLLFTGVRNYTMGHLHADWFEKVDDDLWVKIPSQSPCTKKEGDTICGECRLNDSGGDGFAPKTEAGEGRRIKIPEKWHNTFTDTNEQQDLSLRPLIEHYFKLEPEGYGHEVIDEDGLSKGTVNTYVKIVADNADIGFFRENGYTEHPRLGQVPDVFPHDLRATYCVQLARMDANPWKMCKRTGHEDIESLKPYIKFAEQEIEGDFEDEFI